MSEQALRANLCQLQPAMGSAIWLLALYTSCADFCCEKHREEGWMLVNEGKPVSDKCAADILGVSPRTVFGWRHELMRLGCVEIGADSRGTSYVLYVRAFPQILRFCGWMWGIAREASRKQPSAPASNELSLTPGDVEFLSGCRIAVDAGGAVKS